MEATISIGLVSFGLLTLAPLLAFGLKTSGTARQDRTSAQIAQTMIEEARQGTLPNGPVYLDFQGNVCAASQAAFTAQPTRLALAPSVSRVTLQVTPLGMPDRARTYAVVVQTP